MLGEGKDTFTSTWTIKTDYTSRALYLSKTKTSLAQEAHQNLSRDNGQAWKTDSPRHNFWSAKFQSKVWLHKFLAGCKTNSKSQRELKLNILLSGSSADIVLLSTILTMQNSNTRRHMRHQLSQVTFTVISFAAPFKWE